jgi:hypothetical protein
MNYFETYAPVVTWFAIRLMIIFGITLELARLPKLRLRTKHINVCYHHFREHVRKGLIKIFPIDMKDQIADSLTKALAQNDFQRHCRREEVVAK